MCKRIREIRETKIQQGKDQTISSYDIEFDQVSFSYDKDTEVLKNISFAAKQNEVTALVGGGWLRENQYPASDVKTL